MIQKKKRLIIFLLVLFSFIILFSLIFLCRHLLFEKILLVLLSKSDYFKDYRFSIQNVKGGIFTGFTFYNVVITNKSNFNRIFLNSPIIKLNLSLIDLISIFFFNKPISSLSISLYNSTFYTTGGELPYQKLFFLSGLLPTLDELKIKRFFNTLNLNKLRLKLSDCNFINSSSGWMIIEGLNSEIELDSAELKIKNADFKFLNVPLTLSGYFFIDIEELNFKSRHNSDTLKLGFSVKGKLNNPEIVANISVLNKINYHMKGKLNFKNNKIYFNDADMFYTKEYISNLSEEELKTTSNSSTNESNIYRIYGFYDCAKKTGSFSVKKFLKTDKNLRTIYYDNIKFSQEFDLNFELFNFPEIKLVINIGHLILENMDYITNLCIKGKFGLDKEYLFKGELYSDGSVLNFQPFYEISSQFEIVNKKLVVKNFIMEEILEFTSYVELVKPYNMILKLNTDWIDAGEMLIKFYPELLLNIEGNGKLRLKLEGELKNPYIDGNLVGKDGIINNLEFILLKCNLKGYKNWLEFYNSRILQQDNYYDIYGGFDLSKIDESNFFRDVKFESFEESFLWQGWTVFSKDGGKSLELHKKLGGDIKLGFSTYLQQGTYEDEQSVNGTNGMELEYSLTEDKSLKLEFKSEEGVFGVQRSIKF